MRPYKVCVYGVCKNEEKFAARCMASIKEADLVVMGDTGSTDNTIEVLKSCGAIVHSIPVKPWRFDVARNALLNLIPEDIDICVCIDLDEVLEPGWYEALLEAWGPDTTRARYTYIWSFNKDGSPAVQYVHERIHARQHYHWIYPTHEVAEYIGPGEERIVYIPNLIFKHYPDPLKPRSFNLPLLQLAVSENPTSTRNMHYLGREYYFCGEWQNCIDTLSSYLALPDANWAEERSFAMRYIGNSYMRLDKTLEAKAWLLNAIAEAPHLREAYIEMAQLGYAEQNWPLVQWMIKKALEIKERSLSHYNEAFAWNETPYDLGALAAYYLGDFTSAYNFIQEALRLSPEDVRLQDNLRYIQQKLGLRGENDAY